MRNRSNPLSMTTSGVSNKYYTLWQNNAPQEASKNL